eukprot:gnl/MRDRNA2_/MRDRNA2_243692_c0_seq1.p1 gnl/MRDRNA2_/MRDRNA2_243692_c0~~gnl/MRDRNA2_/MRDRNA2_243692_c0_seq1.p1  ORF type:complete len:234 (-),score=29.14 gnl/MRDRNA2_/MRDRNA2_243692_c0_seq1:27-671(-)
MEFDENGSVLAVANRALVEGEEITWAYLDTYKTRSQFLAQFGFDPQEAPLFFFESNVNVPQHDLNVLKKYDCGKSDQEARVILLYQDPTISKIQRVMRCLRLWWYEPSEINMAVLSGHIDSSLDSQAVRNVRIQWLERDIHVLSAFIQACSMSQPPEVVMNQTVLLPSASAVVQNLIEAENHAIRICKIKLTQVVDAVKARFRALLPQAPPKLQ